MVKNKPIIPALIITHADGSEEIVKGVDKIFRRQVKDLNIHIKQVLEFHKTRAKAKASDYKGIAKEELDVIYKDSERAIKIALMDIITMRTGLLSELYEPGLYEYLKEHNVDLAKIVEEEMIRTGI